MKMTVDQATLRQAVTSHLKDMGVTANIVAVDFRYTRVPYTVFAEVELSEAKPNVSKSATVVEREVVAPVPLVDPDKLELIDIPDSEEIVPAVDTLTPSVPLFGD